MKFVVTTKSGAMISVFAENEKAAGAQLSAKGIRVEKVKAETTVAKRIKPVAAGDIAKFCSALETFHKVHAPMIQALEQIAESSDKGLRPAVLAVLKEMREGKTFDEAVKASGAFPEILPPILKASFQSGKFGESLKLLARIFDEKHSFNTGLIFMLIQPAMVMSIVFAFACFVFYFQVPNDLAMVKEIGIARPSSLKLAIALGDALKVAAPIGLGVLALVFWRFSKDKGRLLARLYPLLESKWNFAFGSVIRCVDYTMFISILSMLAGAGLQQTDIMRSLAAIFAGKPFGEELSRAAADSERHGDLIKALGENVKRLPGDIIFAIKLGMATANLHEITGTVSESYFVRCKREMEKAGLKVSALAMLVCALGIIAMIALTMGIKMQIMLKMSMSGGA